MIFDREFFFERFRAEIFCLCGYLPKEAVGELKEELFPMLYSEEGKTTTAKGGTEGEGGGFQFIKVIQRKRRD